MATTLTVPANGASQKVEHRAGKYLTFQLGNEEFAIQVLRVREIMGVHPQMQPAYNKHTY